MKLRSLRVCDNRATAGMCVAHAALVIAVAIVSGSLASCSRGHIYGHGFSFPPGSETYERNWKYAGSIQIRTIGPAYQRSNKTVWVTVEDTRARLLLDDELEFTCADLKGEVQWDCEEELVIELTEVPNDEAGDAYNRELRETGPRRLARLTYRYNEAARTYERSD